MSPLDPLARLMALCGAGAALILGVMLLVAQADVRHWKRLQEQTSTRLSLEQAAHKATVANYRVASAEAQRRHDADIAAREARYREEGRKASDALSHELGELRRLAAAGKLRPAFAEASAGGSGAGGHPAGGTATGACRAADPAWVCVPSSVVLRGAENEARHDRLIDWAEGVGKVAEPPPAK